MLAKTTITLCCIAGTVFFAFALYHFFLYLGSGLNQEAVATNSYIMKSCLPALLGLLVAVKSRKNLESIFIVLALLPTAQLLLLSLALFGKRWM